MGPTLVDKVPVSSAVYRDEIRPLLSVVRVDGYEDGLQIINDSRHGNGTAIFTNDGGAARRFQREVTVGMVGINVPISCRSRTTRSADGRTRCSAREVVRPPRIRLLHAGEGDHVALARPEPRRHQPGFPQHD